ncbi:MAG: hypothetical protein WAW61_09005 [Methylococcaceae bacterium]
MGSKIFIHPVGTRSTDIDGIKVLALRAPVSVRKAQDVLVAANKYIKKSGLFSTEESRLHKFKHECGELMRALEFDGLINSELNDELKMFQFVLFMNSFSDCYPNWQKEYEAINKLIP